MADEVFVIEPGAKVQVRTDDGTLSPVFEVHNVDVNGTFTNEIDGYQNCGWLLYGRRDL